LEGKGFLGFDEITAENTTLKRKTTTKYEYSSKYYYPYMTEQKITTSGGQVIATTTNTTTFKSYTGSNRFFPYISTQTVTDGLTGLSTKMEITTSTVDDYGNPKTIKTTKGGLTETQTINYEGRGTWSPCPNKIKDIQIERKYDGDTKTRKNAYLYDDNGNLTQETIDQGDPNQMVIKYQSFNSHGQPQKIVTSANGIDRTVEQTYTTSGRFVATSTNVLGEKTTYSWDEAKGVLNSVTDHRSRKTTYGYDNWGQLTSTIHPDGVRTDHSLKWADGVEGKPSTALYYNHTKTGGQSPVWSWYDAKGRGVRQDYLGLNERKIYVRQEYNKLGQLYRTSKPGFSVTPAWGTTYMYDDYGRIKSASNVDMGDTTYDYSSLETTVTTPAGKRKTILNSTGFVVSEEVNDKKVEFKYYASGQVKEAAPEGKGGKKLLMEYNLQGNRTKLTDPDAGIITSKYNGWGELKETSQLIHTTTTANTVTEYDYIPSTGLLNYKKCNGVTTDYLYDAQKRLQEISMPGHKQSFTYDTYDRITKVKEEFDGKTINTETLYDNFGRVKREIYPTGYYTENIYDANGILTEVKDNANRSIWQAMEANARGQLTKIKRGVRETKLGYDSRGFMISDVTTGVMNHSYVYNTKGNMTSRKDGLVNYRDSMTYDNLNRLTNWDVYQGNNLSKANSITYHSTTGNIERKSELGNHEMKYGAGNAPFHALTSIEGAPDNFPEDSQEVSYTDFKKIKTLTEGDKFYELTYGADQQRRKSIYSENNAVKQTRYYFGDYEEEVNSVGNTRKIHYLRGGGIFIQNNGVDSLLYVYTDHLGSLTKLVNEAGNPIDHYAYDPWGNRRNPGNWAHPDLRNSLLLNRGFTGHEHIDQFGIINMNGRVYDPMTSQFFSPDPYVQMPGNWVNYNRYAYCMNNPLIYADPTGEFWHLIIGAAVGGVTNLAFNWKSVDNFWQGLGYFGVGAVAGTLGAGVGAGISSAIAGTGFGAGFIGSSTAMTATSCFVSGAAVGGGAGFAGGFTTGFGNALMGGENFGQALGQGGLYGLIGGASGALIGGLVGGWQAWGENRTFWNGNSSDAVTWQDKMQQAYLQGLDNGAGPVDESTLGKNLLGTDYNGKNNPKGINIFDNKQIDYFGPTPNETFVDYPPLIHDMTYYNKGIDRGAASLFFNPLVKGADATFVAQQLYLGTKNLWVAPMLSLKSYALGIGLAACATSTIWVPYTVYKTGRNSRWW